MSLTCSNPAGGRTLRCRLAQYFGSAPLALFVMLGLLSGCGDTASVDAALDSDANGYLCLGCKAKFYTDRKVFPTKCPDCQKPNIEQVVSFICSADQQATLGPKNVRSIPCAKCGKSAAGLGIPRKADLVQWGAAPKTQAEVN